MKREELKRLAAQMQTQPSAHAAEALRLDELRGGARGGAARAAALSPERRAEIARLGGLARKGTRNAKPPLVRLHVSTYHPQDYVLIDEATGHRWRGTADGHWVQDLPTTKLD